MRTVIPCVSHVSSSSSSALGLRRALVVNTADTPLVGPPPAEVPLRNAPLVKVLAQLRFPLIASIEQRSFVAPFQEAIRRDYPILRPEESRGIALGPSGLIGEARPNRLWRFNQVEGAWRVTLAPDFVSLETTSYSSRDDFINRLLVVLEALREHVDPRVVDRLGVRYIDRVSGPILRDLPTLVRPEVLGVLGSPLAGQAQRAISENVFILPDGSGQVMIRWGLVPAHSTIDPGLVDPIDGASWLLDADAFRLFQAESAGSHQFRVDQIVDQARGFAERIYSIFRWAVTDQFLQRYGG